MGHRKERKQDYRENSFLRGLLSIFSLNNILDDKYVHQYLEGDTENDLSSDWETVGNDLRNAIRKYDKQLLYGK